MEPQRVEIRNWPHDGGPGGWVAPYGELLDHWVVTAMHARYVAPRVGMRFEMHAYLVDLAGQPDLPDLEHVLLHQVPPVRWWYIKPATEADLARIEQYRDA